MSNPNDLSAWLDDDIPYMDGVPDGEQVDAVSKSQNPESNNSTSADGTTKWSKRMLSRFGKWSFPWFLTLSVAKLTIYLNKLYEDSSAVAVYFNGGDLNYCLVSTSCLIIPALIYVIYHVADYVKKQEDKEAETKEIGERVVYGLLLIPWQIKERVEVLHFFAKKVCERRTLDTKELQEKSKLENRASELEFFAEFYAGFIQLLLQVYIIIITLQTGIESKALPGEVIASLLMLMSMMVAIWRKDDGPLTRLLSIVGWLSIMLSRSIAIALATTVIHGWMALACLLHGCLVSLWISSISMKSYRDDFVQTTPPFSIKRKLALFFLVFTVLGLPSLIYWPIMFQLKKRQRPLIFLFLMTVENCLCIAIWYLLREKDGWADHDYKIVGVMVGTFVLGTTFLVLYVGLKPSYVDDVVLYYIREESEKDYSSIYFAFCDKVFKLRLSQSMKERIEKVIIKLGRPLLNEQ